MAGISRTKMYRYKKEKSPKNRAFLVRMKGLEGQKRTIFNFNTIYGG